MFDVGIAVVQQDNATLFANKTTTVVFFGVAGCCVQSSNTSCLWYGHCKFNEGNSTSLLSVVASIQHICDCVARVFFCHTRAVPVAKTQSVGGRRQQQLSVTHGTAVNGRDMTPRPTGLLTSARAVPQASRSRSHSPLKAACRRCCSVLTSNLLLLSGSLYRDAAREERV
jgi:hypothetical protein